MKIIEIDFSTILSVWSTELWPERKSAIEPFSAMHFMGGYFDAKDVEAIFIAGIVDEKIVAVNSCHTAEKYMVRSRGLWVDAQHRGHNYGSMILDATSSAAIEFGAHSIWSFPRQSSWKSYAKSGYIQTSAFIDDGEFGPNCYAIIPLHSSH